MNVLSVENLTVALGSALVLDDVSIEVSEGENVALIGPNGAGKSTLLKAILALLPVRSGSIRLFGKPLAALGKDRDRLGYVPQHLELDRTIPLTVRELMGINTPRRYFTPGAA